MAQSQIILETKRKGERYLRDRCGHRPWFLLSDPRKTHELDGRLWQPFKNIVRQSVPRMRWDLGKMEGPVMAQVFSEQEREHRRGQALLHSL